MPPVTVHADIAHIKAAARILGLDDSMPPGQLGREVIRHIASSPAGHDAMRDRIADAGAAPKRAGRQYEQQVVAHAQERGFPNWERGPLRGVRDLLDLTGTLPEGFLVGAKSTERGVDTTAKLNEAMMQCDAAMTNLEQRGMPVKDIVPVQIFRRQAWPIGKHYAVTTFDCLLDLATERRDLRRAAKGKK